MNDRFRDAMSKLAAEGSGAEPPPGIERAVLAEFERATRRRKMVSWSIRVAAMAAAVVIAVFAVRSPQAPPAPAEVAEAPQESEQPFIPIPYVAQLAPYERAEIVRMNLPVAALISAGFPMRTPDAGARVEADVLVGQDGRARAVRLISVSSFY